MAFCRTGLQRHAARALHRSSFSKRVSHPSVIGSVNRSFHLRSFAVTPSVSFPVVRLFSSTESSTTPEDSNHDKATAKETVTPEIMDELTTETTGTTTSEAKETIVDVEDEPPKERIEFKAETRQILDIMINSLYTDREVFVRELISNASDALEKLRHMQVANTSGAIIDPDLPLEIKIEINEADSTITITDTGIGMTREEMISNLGTIARSGSRTFMEDLKRVEAGAELDPARGIIGRFGVGFYSVFMIADKVEVHSRSALQDHADEPPQMWRSSGDGFEIGDANENIRVDRGTSIRIYLSQKYWDFVNEKKLEGILKRYSNFVGFPILLEGNKINDVTAIWTKEPKSVEKDEYYKFYKYIANAVDDPLDVIHFRADAPIDVKALFFIPSFHQEKYGMGRMEPSVSLYCRKVLIEAKSKDILPDWMRFLKGVVDSEDLPLAVSREKAQDSALIAKLRKALTRKFISHLRKMQKEDNDTFVAEFYKEYHSFLKEGICSDEEFKDQLAKLLYFETSKNPEKDIFSFDQYIANMRPEQKDIYYLCAPDRDGAINSPYMEMFEKSGVEVIFIFTALDDFVMSAVKEYEGRKIVSIESSDIDLGDLMDDKEKDKKDGDSQKDSNAKDDDDLYKSDRELTPEESVEFCNWYRTELKDKVASCSITNRLSTSPAVVTGHESGAMRRYMQTLDNSGDAKMSLPKQHVEVNPKHALIVGIQNLREKEPTLARVLSEQVFDNCLVAAGLLDDSRTMLPRLNDLLLCVVNQARTGQDGATPAGAAEAAVPSNDDSVGSDNDVIDAEYKTKDDNGGASAESTSADDQTDADAEKKQA